MTCIQYRSDNLSTGSLIVIERANEILEDLSAQGYVLTLRQLYYQFVARGLIENTDQSYNRLGKIITKGRMNGLISWDAIEDRNRQVISHYHIETAEEVLHRIDGVLSIDHWERQNHYIEIWVEKDALSGVIERPANRYKLPYLACKGYLSASEAWRAGQRFQRAMEAGKACVLLHLGDHDPSGIDMTRDNQDRLDVFAGMGVDVRRIALNMDQVEQLKPPPNPAKTTDSRARDYIRRFGNDSWELDALEPSYIDKLLSDHIKRYIDHDEWNRCRRLQAVRRRILAALSDNWDQIRDYITDEVL